MAVMQIKYSFVSHLTDNVNISCSNYLNYILIRMITHDLCLH